MSAEPEWVTVDEIIALNRRIVAHTGEPHRVADFGRLDSAAQRSRNHFHLGPEDTHDDIVLLGVKLCIGISQAQAFAQGNKRTGFAAMQMFFGLNGYEISKNAHGCIADLILAAADPDHSLRIDEEDFADEIDSHVVEMSANFQKIDIIKESDIYDFQLSISTAEDKFGQSVSDIEGSRADLDTRVTSSPSADGPSEYNAGDVEEVSGGPRQPQ